MNAFQWRIIDKTITYRLSSTLITIALVYIFTGETSISLAIGGLDIVFKSGWFYFHEWMWAKFDWGKHENDPCK